MKNLFKKISALVLAAIMVLSMCTAVFADGPSATITINNAGSGAKFDYVQVIVADTTEETGWRFADEAIKAKYLAAFDEKNAQTVIKKMIVLETGSYKNETIAAATTEQIETALENVLADNVIMNSAVKDASSPITVYAPGVYAIKGNESGYAYSAMAAYIAFKEYNATTGIPTELENKSINAKKTPTNIEKTSDDENKVVEIGRDVTYTVKGTVPYLPSTKNRFYKIKDTISGATYNVVKDENENKGKLAVTVKIGNTINTTKYVDIENGNSFTLNLDEYVPLANTYANQEITITYSAKVTDVHVGNEIKVGDGTNWNKPDYGSDEEDLYTGEIEILKTDDNKTEADRKPLKDAGFKVYKKDGDKTLYAKFDINNKFNGWTDKIDKATEIKTGTDGKVKVEGLDLGTYWFKEVTAPEGYSLNTNDVSVTLELNDTNSSMVNDVRVANKTITTESAKMLDTKLSALPSTGGMGTYLFTIVGVVLMTCAAGAFFVSRRKTNK